MPMVQKNWKIKVDFSHTICSGILSGIDGVFVFCLTRVQDSQATSVLLGIHILWSIKDHLKKSFEIHFVNYHMGEGGGVGLKRPASNYIVIIDDHL